MSRRMFATPEELRLRVTEAEMESVVTDLITLKGGRVWHLRDARRAPELIDLPDLIFLCPPYAGFIELKSATRRVTAGQENVAILASQCPKTLTGIVRPWDVDDLLETLNGGKLG